MSSSRSWPCRNDPMLHCPFLCVRCRRYNPTKNYLQLELDMTFQSSGFQCIVRFRCLHIERPSIYST